MAIAESTTYEAAGRSGSRELQVDAVVDDRLPPMGSSLFAHGSRRWGPVSRVLLGSTGEALLHGAACPVLVVPRPTT